MTGGLYTRDIVEALTRRLDQVLDIEALRHTNRAAFDLRRPSIRTDARRVFRAVVILVFANQDDHGPRSIIQEVTGLDNGFGAWLDYLADAIATVNLTDAGLKDGWRSEMQGALSGVVCLIFKQAGHA